MIVKWHGDKVEAEIKRRQSMALRKAGAMLEGVIKRSMQTTSKDTSKKQMSRGVVRQKRQGKKLAKYHYPSKPGFPPAIDTGRLVNSITWQASDGHGSSISAPATEDDKLKNPEAGPHETICIVGTNVEYGRFLELGTIKTRPRPYLRIALEAKRKSILKLFQGGK